MALPNRGQKAVKQAIQQLQRRLPFPLLGLDSDNGTEFTNGNLFRYCKDHGITFTRSRPYRKNDQAFVEQKNWTVVRQIIGYDRYEGSQAVECMQALYQVLRLYVNFFQPVMKLKSKRRVGSRVAKKYDIAKTPYRRVWQSSQIKVPAKLKLQQQYLSLNPAALLREIQTLQKELWRLTKG